MRDIFGFVRQRKRDAMNALTTQDNVFSDIDRGRYDSSGNLIVRQREPSTPKTKILNWEAIEEKSYKKSKQAIIKREAKKAGRKRAEEEIFAPVREIERQRAIKKERIERLKGAAVGIGGFAARRIKTVAGIQTPKVSSAAKRGLFNRKKFGRV